MLMLAETTSAWLHSVPKVTNQLLREPTVSMTLTVQLGIHMLHNRDVSYGYCQLAMQPAWLSVFC